MAPRSFRDDALGRQPQHAVGPLRCRGRVRHQQAGRARAVHLLAQHGQHAFGGHRVEIAGGFVGQDQAGRVHHGAGDGHALQLPTR